LADESGTAKHLNLNRTFITARLLRVNRLNHLELKQYLLLSIEERLPVKLSLLELTDFSANTLTQRIFRHVTMTYHSFSQAEAFEKANQLTDQISDQLVEELKYILKLPKREQEAYDQELQLNDYFIRRFAALAKQKGQTEFADKLEAKLKDLGL